MKKESLNEQIRRYKKPRVLNHQPLRFETAMVCHSRTGIDNRPAVIHTISHSSTK